MIISFIPKTWICESEVMLWGEIRCLSLLGVKGLRSGNHLPVQASMHWTCGTHIADLQWILLVSTLGNLYRTEWRICILMLGCAGLLTFSFHACIQRCTLFWWQYVLFLGTSQRTRSWHVWSCWWKGMPESMYMTSKWAYQTPVSSLIIWLAVLCLVKILVIALFFFFCVCFYGACLCLGP